MRFTEVLVLLFFAAVAQAQQPIVQTTNTCQDNLMKITCTNDQVIQIFTAMFGRSTTDTCGELPMRNLQCSSSTALTIVTQQCGGKTACSIPAVPEVFGDPCPDTTKYLSVEYACIPREFSRAQVCQNGYLQVSCPSGYVLDVNYVNWGRTDPYICPTQPIETYVCHSNVTSRRGVCQGFESCVLTPTTADLGDPCPGTSKYLDVEYRCVTTTLICENNSRAFSCPPGKVIGITGGFYGRTNRSICPSGTMPSTNCSSAIARDTIFNTCDGLQSCQVAATDAVFGNPCVGTSKYATVTWYCRNN